MAAEQTSSVPQGRKVMPWESPLAEHKIQHWAQVTMKSYQQQNNGPHS